MFSLTKPSDDEIERFLIRQSTSKLSYEPVGLSGLSPDTYNVDDYRVVVGHGLDLFERAKTAIDSWSVLRLDWVDVRATTPSPEIGTDVAVLARHLGFWSLNACRVVGRFPASSADTRYGFAYGTLNDHAECGEELFAIDFGATDGTVWYEVRAVSRPRAMLARVGYPYSRWVQRKFREDSARSLMAAIRG